MLYSFPNSKQGYVPWGDLVFDKAGNLYGATEFGGGKGTNCDNFYQYCGAVFELSPPKKKDGKWTEKVLHAFASGSDGAWPNGGPILDHAGTIYGTTQAGGHNCPHHSSEGCGTVFKLEPPNGKSGTWTETILHRFRSIPDGATPAAGVTLGESGILYGTTEYGGGGETGQGTVFSVRSDKGLWTEHVLYSFQDGDDGALPVAPVLFQAKGSVYATALGGETHLGVVFQLKAPKHGSPWSLTILYNLAGPPDGSHPRANLVRGGLGSFYSTTSDGGTGTCGYAGCGTVFEVSP